MNNDPTMSVSIGENEFEMHRNNSFLFTFLGELGIHDHVFLVTHPEESAGTFVFKVAHPEAYQAMAAFMVENSFLSHFNLQSVCDSDRDAFESATMKDMLSAESFPEEWETTAGSE